MSGGTPRRRLGLGPRLFLLSMGLIAAAVVVAEAFLTSALDRHLTDRIRDELFVRLDLVEQAAQAPVASWDRLADEAGVRARVRVSVIGIDGRVLGDSELDEAQLATVENHRDRPEVAAALRHGRGIDTRASATLQQRMMYVARPLRRGAGTAGVLRAAVPLAEVDADVGRARLLLVLGALLALGVASVLSAVVARRIARGVEPLLQAAGRMAGGDLSVRTRAQGDDELAELGRALDQLAEGLSRTMRELRGERDLVGGVLAAMHEGVLVLDQEGRIALLNPALRAMVLPEGESAGRRPIEVLRHAELVRLLEEARAGTPPARELELPGLRPRRVLVHASPLPPGGAVAVFVDVTDVRRLEALRRDFVANASHELRTPVTAIVSAAETLRQVESDAGGARAQAAPFVDMIERNAARLRQLVDDLLDLSRIESREFRLHPETLSAADACARTLEAFGERARSRLVSLRSSGDARVRADRRALEQVLANLVDNAIKYCPAGSRVQLRAAQQDGTVRLSVEDDGPGIAAPHLPRLFERFYRVDAGRSREVGGTGLGLSIVKHLVEAMGGDVEVESTPGKGSTFTVRLPAA